mmetsp:Transcript_1629/g.5136  ORF Transcript_1629/g.5136 Transcript_1629/m.5136 type:complete len:419 (-) Transcript_1629:247-1503(-)
MRLVAIRLVNDLLNVRERVDLLEREFPDALRELALEDVQDGLTATLASVKHGGVRRVKLAAHGQYLVDHGASVVRGHWSQRLQLLLHVLHPLVDSLLDLGNLPDDGLLQLPAQFMREGAHANVPQAPVVGASVEELHLALAALVHRDVRVNVGLGPVHHGDPPVLELDRPSLQDVTRVCSPVHDVQLCENSDGPLARWVDLSGEPDAIACGDIGVRWGDRQDDRVLALDVGPGHVLNVPDNGFGLTLDGDFGEPGHVHQSEVGHVRRVDGEVDGLRGHSLAAAERAVGLRLDLLSDGLEVGELLIHLVQELAVLLGPGLALHELQEERPPGHDAGAAGKEILAHHGLQHGALAAALPADHHDARQDLPQARESVVLVAPGIVAQRGAHLLQLVHELAELVHGANRTFANVGRLVYFSV